MMALWVLSQSGVWLGQSSGVGEASVHGRIVDLTSDRDDNEADTGADIGTASTDKGSATPGSPSDVLVASGSKTTAPSSAPVYRGAHRG